MASLRQNSQFEGSPRMLRRMTSVYQDGQISTPGTLRRMASMYQDGQMSTPRTLRRMTSMYQDSQMSTPRTLRRMTSMYQEDGQTSTPRTLRRMASTYQDGQFEQTLSPRMLRRTTSFYQDYEVPRSPRMLTKMANDSMFQEARSPVRPSRMTGMHSETGPLARFETGAQPRTARQMPTTSLFPDDLLAPRMTRSPLPRTGSFYDGSQFEGGGSLTRAGNLYQESGPKLSPIPSKKMTSMFEVARSMEKIKSLETNNLSPPETKVS